MTDILLRQIRDLLYELLYRMSSDEQAFDIVRMKREHREELEQPERPL